MIFSQFISKATKYLKSVRVLKNYISFDMIFPKTWMVLKKFPEGIEVIQTETENGNTITSFVCENNKTLIDILEQTFESYVKTNIEREEKEKLFKSKGFYLQTSNDCVEELTKILQDNEPEEINAGDTETH